MNFTAMMIENLNYSIHIFFIPVLQQYFNVSITFSCKMFFHLFSQKTYFQKYKENAKPFFVLFYGKVLMASINNLALKKHKNDKSNDSFFALFYYIFYK